MKVLEVKNNLVKIEYNQEDNLLLAGFVVIEDSLSPYVAQIMSLKADNGMNYAIVKLLFTFNDEGILKNYNGSIPSLDAEVTRLDGRDLLDILPVNTPVEIGNIANQDIALNVDMSIFEKNLLICSDNYENSNILLENFIYQLTEHNCKSVVFDNEGSFGGQKLSFGLDFKLPLNYETINYIYEHDLGNVDPASKAVIQDIFLEVQEYSKTVLEKFIPFDNFLAVVDEQYRATGIPELVLLKNKLLRYKEMNVFAQSPKEIQSLQSAIRANMTNTLDISSAEESLQNEIIKYVYNTIDDMDLFVYSFVQLNNGNADKRIIRHFLTKNKIYTTTICSHNFKYIYELKERANNMILFAPLTMQHDFSAYNTFLNKLNSDEFLIYGKATQHMPLIVELVSMVEEEIPEPAQADTYAEEQSSQAESVEPAEDSFSEESNSYSYETLIEDTAVQDEEAANQVDEETSEKAADEIPSSDSDEPISNDTQTQSSEALETSESEIPDEQYDETGDSEEEEVESEEDIEDSDEEEEYEEEIEEVDSQNSVDEVDTVLDAEDDEQEDETEPEEVSETPQDESDEVDTETLTNIIDEEIQAEALNPADSEEIIDGEFKEIDDNIEHLESSIEESSLDMPENDSNMELPPIEGVDETELPDNAGSQDEDTNALDDRVSKDVDELIYSSEKQEIPSIDDIVENENSEDSLTEEDLNFIQDVNSPTTEDSLPVYPAETPEGEGKDELALAAGDHVSHPKYGEGVIEKIIRYGNKALCSISFINVGRRLLDPAISEITKLD